MKKFIPLLIAIMLCATICLSACANTDFFVVANGDVNNFDTSLFYGNTKTMQGADPSLIYVAPQVGEDGTVDPDTGFYYAYVTATSTINAWRTKDMTNWQYLGAVFRPDLDTFWGYTNFWAPAVYHDEASGIYYMFYSASKRGTSNTHYVSLATSTTPDGPFVEYDTGVNQPLVDFSNIPKDSPAYQYRSSEESFEDGYFAAIDAEPFVDADGTKYLLFTQDRTAGYSSSATFIMKMDEWWQPDYSTVKCLTVTGYTTVGGAEEIDEGTVNEGPYMLYHDGLYYLTFSVHSYDESIYQVRQAVGESPMGPFRKVPVEKGGAVLTTDGLTMYTNSSGHHSFITVGDQLYISYHTFKNDESIDEARKIRFDKVSFVTNEDGLPLIYANGPTVTLQPLPCEISGYENKAESARVYATNLADGSDVYWLTDGTLKIHANSSLVDQTYFNKGKSKITLVWDDYVSAKTIMVYNSCEFTTTFTAVDNIRIKYRQDGKEGTVDTGRIAFDYDAFSLEKSYFDVVYAGASVTIQFADMDVISIEITISEPKKADVFAVSEVTVLGRRNDK